MNTLGRDSIIHILKPFNKTFDTFNGRIHSEHNDHNKRQVFNASSQLLIYISVTKQALYETPEWSARRISNAHKLYCDY